MSMFRLEDVSNAPPEVLLDMHERPSFTSPAECWRLEGKTTGGPIHLKEVRLYCVDLDWMESID